MQTETTKQEPRTPVRAAADRSGKYLAFLLGIEEYAVRVLQVREIIGLQEMTPVPQTPAYVRGVINLRGKVVPVVDLRRKFGLPAAEVTNRTCIIVVQTPGAAGPVPVGLLVDAVCEVAVLSAADIEDTPDFGGSLPCPFLLGLAKTKGKVRILLDIDAVLSHSELQSPAVGKPENA
jgi:purine-binding chemotaxis protein CheW